MAQYGKKRPEGGRKRQFVRIVWAALALGALLALRRSGLLDAVGSVEELRAMIDRTGALGGTVFFFAQMLTVILAPIPSNVTMLAGAMALGFLEAMTLGVAAVICGSVLVFLAARRLGREAVRRFLERGVMDRYLPMIEEKRDMFLFLTMLFPFFPDDVLCMLAGLTEMPLSRFVIIMAAARPWGLVFAALLGSGAFSMPVWGWAALVPAFAAAFYLALRFSAAIEERLLALVRRMCGRNQGGEAER